LVHEPLEFRGLSVKSVEGEIQMADVPLKKRFTVLAILAGVLLGVPVTALILRATSALIVPPGFGGDPAHLPTIEATSNKIWLVYRFHVTTEDDLAMARTVQDQLTLTPLAEYHPTEQVDQHRSSAGCAQQ